ncbi:MAG: methyltransferase domain-containing protein [bacterium]|nr:methyltransferase domain-containing protein [bacterium]
MKTHLTRPAALTIAATATVLVLLWTGAADGRAVKKEAERIADAMGVCEGMTVADVGAGDGEWSIGLAKKVGESGRIYATEVDEDDLPKIRKRAEKAGLGNVSAVLGDDHDTGLPEGCCDAILLRQVYHHFTDPPAMRASLRRAMRPGAKLVVIDLDPQKHWRDLPGVPDRGGHGIELDDLVEEMTGDGFVEVARHEVWPGEDEERYCVVFRRASTPVQQER